MESYVVYLQGLYVALIESVLEYYPNDRVSCRRDSSRLLSLAKSRGLPFFMIDLPDAGKHFDQCLASGRLIPSGIAGQRPYKKGATIPRLFKGLLQRVFSDNGMLREDPDVITIRLLRQLYYAGKKMKVACDDSVTWEHVHEFFKVDSEVDPPTLNWADDQLRISDLRDLHFCNPVLTEPALPLFPDLHRDERESRLAIASTGILEAVQRTADIVSAELGGFNPLEWRVKHGPGAVADQHRTQFKYDFPSWPAKLEGFFPSSEFAFANYGQWVDFLSGNGTQGLSDVEYPSKIIAVPKTLKGPRLIASEPVAHQWCQQSIKDFLTSRLTSTSIRSSIHFRDQRFNQELAKRASHTQSHATIDLSSASDRLSLWCVERLFRMSPSLILALHASRTRWVVNTIDRKSPKYHILRKFACMGSACTFPVQSYAFCIFAIATLLHHRGIAITQKSIRKASREVQVFGDDIIIPLDCSGVFQGLLGHLRLKVNRQKTFETGKFRESCGLDAYDGHDVTPTYSMTYPDVSRPESIVSIVETHNNFAKRGLYRVSDYIRTTVRKLNRFRLPFVADGSGMFGYLDYWSEGNHHLKRRWNPKLQRIEYLADAVRTASSRLVPNSDSVLLQYFTEARSDLPILGDRLGVVTRTSTSIRRRWVSSDLLQGYKG